MNADRVLVFLAVYEKGSVQGASAALRLTPSAVSQGLSLFEKELGVRLFQRFPRKLLPTEQAKALHAFLRPRLDEQESFLSSLRSSNSEPSGTLRIGAPPEFGSRLVTKTLAKLRRFSRARIHMRFGLVDNVLGAVVSGDLDLAFCDNGPYVAKYKGSAVWDPIFEEHAVLVASPAFHQEFIHGNFTFAHLSKLPHIDYTPGGDVLSLWYRHSFGKTPARLDIRFAADHVGAVLAAASDGVGLAFVPRYLAQDRLKSSVLKEIKVKEKDYTNSILLFRAKARVPTLLEKEFLRELGSVLATCSRG